MSDPTRLSPFPRDLDEDYMREITESLRSVYDVIEAYRQMRRDLKDARFMLAAVLLTNGPVRITPRMLRDLDDKTEVVRVDRLDGTIELAARPPMQGAPREQVEAGK